MGKATKKHPVKWIVMAVCLVLVIGATLVGIWQRNNIKAIWLMLTADEQALAERDQEKEQFYQEILDKYSVKDTSEYEFPEDDGKLNVDVFLENVEDSGSAEDSTEDTTETPEASAEAEAEAKRKSDEVIQQCIAAMYVLEDQYVAKLDGVVEETKAEYRQIPKAERSQAKKLALVNSKKDKLLAMEKECDGEVEKLLSKIQQELDKQGDKSKLVSEIRQAYTESKATWKAACLTALSK